MERLAVKVRTLKVEATGDFFDGKITPRIRLAGRWLNQAGFKAGHRAEVRSDAVGQLTLLFKAVTENEASA